MLVTVNATKGDSFLLYLPNALGRTPCKAAVEGTSLVMMVYANQAPRMEIITPRLRTIAPQFPTIAFIT